ncbi:alpha/beta hydrolase [bacterium]|nr:alpha/beta hydrolase [bacterium]
MKIKRVAIVFLSVVAVLVIVGLVMVNSWKQTEHGSLDTNAAVLLKYIEFSKIDLFSEGKTPAQIREISAKGRGLSGGKQVPVQQVRDTTFPGPAGPVPIRIYTPQQHPKLPIILFYHGGGWVIGDLDSHDNLCRALSVKLPGIVVSVDYRLAPEHAFPAAVNDAYAALLWVSQHAASINGDASKIIVAGDSAGGNLAAVVSLMSREKNGPDIAAQVLMYPATNLAEMTTVSYKNFGDGHYLTHRYMKKFRSLYLPQAKDWRNMYASPLLASNHENLPPAIVLTAEFDVLRDEGEAYARKLKNAGVPTTQNRYKGMIHGFVNMAGLFSQSEKATDDIVTFIKELPSF